MRKRGDNTRISKPLELIFVNMLTVSIRRGNHLENRDISRRLNDKGDLGEGISSGEEKVSTRTGRQSPDIEAGKKKVKSRWVWGSVEGQWRIAGGRGPHTTTGGLVQGRRETRILVPPSQIGLAVKTTSG